MGGLMMKINTLSALVLGLMMAACNDPNIESGTNKKPSVEQEGITFESVTHEASRTTITHTPGNGALAFWETGDYIFVRPTSGAYEQSEAGTLNTDKTRGVFKMPNNGRKYTDQCEVRYTGKNGTSANRVTIASSQSQSTANDFSHAGESGDCGSAKASGSGQSFKFNLEHKAAYLCFLPRCMNTALGPNIRLTKIVITSQSGPIAGTYDFSSGNLSTSPISGSSNTITLTTNNFLLSNTSANPTMNASYMVIAPSNTTRTFKIDYYIKDPVTTVEGAISKTLTLTTKAGEISDVTANLTPAADYSSSKYYMWDALENFWYQHEWDVFPESNRWQLTMNGTTTYANFPTSSDANRWFNPAFTFAAENNATRNAFFKASPNANMMLWYVKEGDPHWDDQNIWSMFGHLYCGGMWIKKSTRIAQENSTNVNLMRQSYKGYDYRIESTFITFENTNVKPASSLTSKNNYFYLPALGRLDDMGGGSSHLIGFRMDYIGISALYAGSSASGWRDEGNIPLYFDRTKLYTDNRWNRYHGMSVQPTWFY